MTQNLIGQTLGKYRILAEIGRGGMGVVYKAHDTTLDCPVAIKVLDPLLARDQEFVQRFLREARATARLRRHPHIVTIHDVGQSGGYSFIVMEHLEGRSLVEIIRREGPLPPERVARLVSQVADALDYAHAQGLIHRDVKPGNVIVGPQDQATLTDFGVARSVEGTRLTQSGVMIGTPAYMSPEQVKGQSVGPAADVYALGVVTYEMLGGRPPFEGETPHVLFAHAYEPPPPLRQVNPRVPEAVAAAVHKALVKDPKQRYPTAGAFAAALGQAAGSPVVEATRRLPPGRQPFPPATRAGQAPLWPLFGVLGAVLVVAVLTLATGRFGGGSVTPEPSRPVVMGTGSSTDTPVPATLTPTPGHMATPTLRLTLTATPIPTFTATPRSTATPTATPTRTATLTRTLTPRPTSSPTPTARVTATWTAPAPSITLLEPKNGASSSGCVTFNWQWSGTLQPGEVYDLRVCQSEGCAPRFGISNDAPVVVWNPTDTRSSPDLQGTEGVYRWQVVVIDQQSKQEKGPRSEVGQFTWTGGACGPQPPEWPGCIGPTCGNK
jgi:serine/threonine protein kinase